MKIACILPTYNERENILSLLEKLNTVSKACGPHEFSYVVVDDYSPDGTGDLIRKLQKKQKNLFLLQGKKEGLGKALLRGMTYAVETLHATHVLQMDCDLSHDPMVIPAFIKKLENGADFVVGSRYIPGGSIPSNWGIHRKLFSVVGNAIVRFGLGYSKVHDWTGGYRMYDKKYVESLKHEMTEYSGYVFQIAFLHKAIVRGAHVGEVPIDFTDRKFGHSKIAPFEYIKNVLLYVLMNGSFGKFLIVGGVGFIINAIFLVIFREWGKLSPSAANLIGAAVAIFSNFNLNNIWTFKEEKITTVLGYIGKLLQFYATSILGVIFIQTGTIEILTRMFGTEMYFIFFLIGTFLLLIYNYMMYSKVIWKKAKSV